LTFLGKSEEINDFDLKDFCENCHVLCYLGYSKFIQIYDLEGSDLKQKEFINNVGTFGDYGIVSMAIFSKEKGKKNVLWF